MKEKAKRYLRWSAKNWMGLLGVFVGLGGIHYGIHVNLPRQELSYRVNPSFEVFNAEENQQFLLAVKCQDTNSSRKLDGVEEITKEQNISFKGNT